MSLPGPEPKRVTVQEADSYLSETYGWPLDYCARVLATATGLQPSPNARPTDHGLVEVVRDGSDFIITDRGSRHRK